MVNAEIELVEHPGRRGALEQVERPVDQIIIIEQRAALFLSLVTRDHVGGDRDQRAGAVARGHGAFAGKQCAHTVLFTPEPFEPRGMVLDDRLGDDILSGCQLRCAEHTQIIIDAVAAETRLGGA